MKKECDIILLSYESPDLLKKCVESVLESTRVRSTLIIVDNNSRDPAVKEYLDTVHGNTSVDIEKVMSETNAGFAGGINKGMKLSDAPYVCILNNDCVVTEGWLEEMISVAESAKNIGLVNPQSNTFGSAPEHNVLISEYAKLLADKKGKYVELGHAIGFACLIKREVIDQIGYLDESYKGVCYEDTDYSAKAQKAGYIAVMAEGAYVFHLEQASRRKLKDKERIYAYNKALFETRWGRLLRVLYVDRTKDLSRGRDEVAADYEALKFLARQRVIVDMWVIDTREAAADHYSEMEKLTSARHADIGVKFIRGGISDLRLVWKVLTKKKKYDAVILREGIIAPFLNFMKPFSGTRVFVLQEGRRVRSFGGETFDLNKPSLFTGGLRR